MSLDPEALSPDDRAALLRWRLVLGPGAEQVEACLGLSGLSGLSGLAREGESALEPEPLDELDQALEFVYGDRAAGSTASSPYIPKWLSLLRRFFRHEVVALVQQDAIEKRGLTRLLFEPETLPFLERNVDLVATLVQARGLIPDKAKTIAREIVAEVVDELRKKLATEVRTAILGALKKSEHSPMKVLRNLDWKRTIRSNLKGWDAENQRLVPERLYFWANQRRHHEWDVAILVDQSGSMTESVIYSSVMAAIFASLDVLRTRLLFFSTEVVDVTPLLVDPVELLFSTQLGGGTDINRAVAYAQAHFIERPEKTLFILITDLYEGGNAEELVGRMRQLVDSRVKTLCLLALSDGGRPFYDPKLAAEFARLGVPCFGCTPKLLIAVVERLMKGQDIAPIISEVGKGKR